MRKRFEAQLTLGSTPISKIEIPISRDEFPPFLRAVQYLYCDENLSNKVYMLLESKLCQGKATGRPGMDLWTLFVLAGARLCLNTDFDRLEYIANTDTLLRKMLGVHDGIVQGKTFDVQTIKDNVSLLDTQTLQDLNQIIVEAAHGILKKKEAEALRIKVDSFVTESNVHFPTDYNLLWDSARKCLDTIDQTLKSVDLLGWRKLKLWKKALKNQMLIVSRATVLKSKNREEQLKTATEEYIRLATTLSNKIQNLIDNQDNSSFYNTFSGLQLLHYHQLLNKHIDLVTRRILNGETIPSTEKLYSIFEPHTEWITKGKRHKPVELGKRTLIATDQWHFIVDYYVADHQQDTELLLPCIDRIRAHHKVASCSADRGFYSKDNREILELFGINPILPKKGKRSQADHERESNPSFIAEKRKHSAIESNINQLENNGLDRCRSKGIRGFRRYVGLAVIAYNLHRIGTLLLKIDQEQRLLRAA